MAAGMPAHDDLMAEIPNMRTTIDNVTDSITSLQHTLAELTAHPSDPFDGEGPMIRARYYEHALDSDRREFSLLMETE